MNWFLTQIGGMIDVRRYFLGPFILGAVYYSSFILVGLISRHFKPAAHLVLGQDTSILIFAVLITGYTSWVLSEHLQSIAALAGIAIAIKVALAGSEGVQGSMFLLTPLPYIFFGLLGGVIGACFTCLLKKCVSRLCLGLIGGLAFYCGMLVIMFVGGFINILCGGA